MIDVRGVALALHPPGEGVSDGIRSSGDFYEPAILDYLRDNHRVQGVIVDAGAFIGNHTLYFATFLDYERIVAFEPVPANYDLLVANVGHLPGVDTHPIALSARAGTLRMDPNPANMGASLVTEGGSIEVPAVSLDSLELTGVTLIKLDVEDHEELVLEGARRTIAMDHPLILMEDWTFGTRRPDGYELEFAWPEAFTYLYAWRNE